MRTLIEEIVGAVTVAKIVKLPRFLCGLAALLEARLSGTPIRPVPWLCCEC